MSEISVNDFSHRFLSIILNNTVIPKKAQDLHILLYSATLNFQPNVEYTEKEVNRQLQSWCETFGKNMGLDHVSLRRALIDERYLRRDASGTHYMLDLSDLPYQFDSQINSLDLRALLSQAIEEKERRKQEFLNRSKANP